MSRILLDELPDCIFCKEDIPMKKEPAKYDAPTVFGTQWAKMCEFHAQTYSSSARLKIGTEFQLRPDLKIKKAYGMQLAIEPGLEDLEYWEAVIINGLRTPECPQCGEIRNMEPDATQFICDGCGTECQMREGLC